MTTKTFDESLYSAMEWRSIGPFRGGRSTTSSGVKGQPNVYYFGSVGGGVWKSEDAGISWSNISDKFFNTASIGAISVAESDPNVIYAGTGEACIRGVMTSSGDGMYKSTDAGRTWKHIGLENSLHISEIRIHPNNPDLVYVAVQGSPYASTQDRGIYQTSDGGKTWNKIHFVNEVSGASNLSMDMNNPRILYAAYWDHQRKPWFIRSGGSGSGIYKTTDGGETWEKLTEGLPKSVIGKIGVSVSRANSSRVYAVIESEEGGLYRSDDYGKSWRLMNSDRILRARSWYYMHVYTDPKNAEVVYVLNAPFMKSIDGGRTFTNVGVPHGDNHDLWINPDDPLNMINSNDGGANVSFNGGKSWSTQQNQPTAQFYRVIADNRFPYWVYAGQQDNSTLATPTRTDGFAIGWKDWIANVGGGEAAHIAFNPDDPTYIFSSNITGFIDLYNLKTGKQKAIKPWPIMDLGEPSDEMKYRYNWNPPVIVSRHNLNKILYASNLVHRSMDKGVSWEDISPDLTRNDTAKLGLMGGPITNEAAGAETYHTIMTLAESPHNPQIIWTGADDGLVHLSQDGGNTWKNVSPGPEGIINSIDESPHTAGTVYITMMRYKFNDFTPYVYKSTNYGHNWQLITNGIASKAFVRVVREDPGRKDLLYAGTELGMFVSFDGGSGWKEFQLNLPMVAITDLTIHSNDLIVATNGRSFWVLDDLTPLHQLSDQVAQASAYLFKPRDVINTGGGGNPNVPGFGRNPYSGASIKYYVKSRNTEDTTEFSVLIKDGKGNIIRTLSNNAENPADKINPKSGMNIAQWNLTVASIKTPSGIFVPGNGFLAGYQVGPGSYTAELIYGTTKMSQTFNVLKDPRDEATEVQITAKQQALEKIYQDLNELYESLIQLKEVREQIKDLQNRLPNEKEVQENGTEIVEDIDDIEKKMVSPKQQTFQDIINFRNQLNTQLYNLLQTIDGNLPPLTNGEKELYKQLNGEWTEINTVVERILGDDLSEFNQLLRDKGIEYVAPKQKKKKDTIQ